MPNRLIIIMAIVGYLHAPNMLPKVYSMLTWEHLRTLLSCNTSAKK